MKIIMLGAPGVGKGTQSEKIAKLYGIPHISTGDIFRENIKNNTALGKKAREYMDGGNLVPDELTCNLVADRIKKDDCKDGFILDGFPRTIPQAEMLENTLLQQETSMDYAIDIEVPDENIINRMGGRRACSGCGKIYHIVAKPPRTDGICDVCGKGLVVREDDNPDTVKNRLNVYHDRTQPLIDFYKKKGILRTVDGTDGMEAVFRDIKSILGE